MITTAQVPGRRPPVLVTAEVLARMRPGSVLVDLAASSLGGNVEGSVAGQTVVTGNGVSVVGASEPAVPAGDQRVPGVLPQRQRAGRPPGSDGALAIDLTDEIQQGVVVTHRGEIVHQPAPLADSAASDDAKAAT